MITYIQDTILIKEQANGQTTERAVQATVAECVGLAYRIEPGDEDFDPIITLTHVHSGIRVGGEWRVSTEHEARAWIEALDEIIDWTGDLPRIRPGMHYKVLHLATIGALHELGAFEQGESTVPALPEKD